MKSIKNQVYNQVYKRKHMKPLNKQIQSQSLDLIYIAISSSASNRIYAHNKGTIYDDIFNILWYELYLDYESKYSKVDT